MKLNKENFKKLMENKIGFMMTDIDGKKVLWKGEFPEGCDFLCLSPNTLISDQNKKNWCDYIGLEEPKEEPKDESESQEVLGLEIAEKEPEKKKKKAAQKKAK